MAAEPIAGRCPACGYQQLKRGYKGAIICDWEACPDPRALNRILADPFLTDHIIHLEISAQGRWQWCLQHPLIERADQLLFDCDLVRNIASLQYLHPGLTPGDYRVQTDLDGAIEFVPLKVET